VIDMMNEYVVKDCHGTIGCIFGWCCLNQTKHMIRDYK